MFLLSNHVDIHNGVLFRKLPMEIKCGKKKNYENKKKKDSFKEKLQPSWIYYIILILLCPFVWLKCWNSAFPVKSAWVYFLPNNLLIL